MRIHHGTVAGVFGALCEIFVSNRQPSVPQMFAVYRELRRELPAVLKNAGAHDPYNARVFRELGYIARNAASS